jgi:hypothetical protein
MPGRKAQSVFFQRVLACTEIFRKSGTAGGRPLKLETVNGSIEVLKAS